MLAVMCVGYFLVLLDVTVVNVALPSIATGLHSSVGGLQWVVDSYAIVLAAAMLVAGTVGDLYGHRRVVLAGLALFGLASLGCGLAPGTGALVAARALQGLGAALVLPGTLAIISRSFPEEGGRARAIGVWAGVGSIALPAGPLLGGLLVDVAGWRSVFLLNIPIVAVALVVTSRVVKESREPTGRRLDLAGAALGALALASVTFAFIEAGRSGHAPEVIVAAAVGFVVAAAFVAVERSLDDPTFPLALLRRPGFAAANGVAGTMNLATLGVLFLITLYLQTVQHRTPFEAGAALIPLFLPLALIAPLIGRVVARTGARGPMVAGLIVAAAGLGLLVTVDAHSSYLALVPGLLLWGVGIAVLTPAVVAAAIGAVPSDRAGLGSAVNNTARQAGGAVGIAAFGALAGAPEATARFMSGLHEAVILAAAMFLAAAAATLRWIGPAAR